MYSLDRSIPTDFLPSSYATFIVVPVPLKGSRTRPFIGQVDFMGIMHNSSGYGAKCILRCGEKLKTYFPYQNDDINEISDEISYGE